jgi:NAD+ synthase (glutamine-hydrolysing)
MRIAQAQINSILGDFDSNSKKILAFVLKASEQKCDLIIFPELSLFGYLPMDLLENDALVNQQLLAFRKLHSQIPKGIAVLIGLVTKASRSGKAFYNSAALLEKNKKPQYFHKELLPSYDVFDETRFFKSGKMRENIFKIGNKKFLVTLCEDIWAWGIKDYPSYYDENPVLKIKERNLAAIINLSASPFYPGKPQLRLTVVKKLIQRLKCPVLYTNMIGAQDEVIFDGASFVVDEKSKVVLQAPSFEESLQIFELGSKKSGIKKISHTETEEIFSALVLGIRDFVHKTGFKKVHLGLSGGIDSAVVVSLAVKALGSENVSVLALPGPYNSPESLSLANLLAANLNISMHEISIQKTYETALQALQKSLGTFDFGILNENMQSRLRGLFLMAYSNKENSLLLTTGNKSELATGYATLYGDMCGALNPIGDLVKSQVYDLARFVNRDKEIIPEQIISREPSAELRPDQKDQDSLPAYDQLDQAVRNLIEHSQAPKNEIELWLALSLRRSEFKRWQAPPILKMSRHAFGRGRRMPIAGRFNK